MDLHKSSVFAGGWVFGLIQPVDKQMAGGMGTSLRSGSVRCPVLQTAKPIYVMRPISSSVSSSIGVKLEKANPWNASNVRGSHFLGKLDLSQKQSLLKTRASPNLSLFTDYDPPPKKIEVTIDTRSNPYSSFKVESAFYITARASYGLPWLFPFMEKYFRAYCLSMISENISADQDGVMTFQFTVEFNKKQAAKTWGRVEDCVPRRLVRLLKESLIRDIPEAGVVTCCIIEPPPEASDIWGKKSLGIQPVVHSASFHRFLYRFMFYGPCIPH